MPRFLAIDADAHGLVVAAGTARGSAVRLDQTLVWREDAQPLTPASAKALGGRLKELLRQAGIAPAPALLCVGRDRVILKDVRHPPAPPADEPAVVRFQAVKELADAPEEVVLDYVPLGAADGAGGERRALVASLRREMMAAAKVFAEAAGLKLAAVTPRPFAAAAAARRAVAGGAAPAPDSPDDPVAVVTLSEGGGEFTVARGPQVRFARTIPPAAVASEQALIAELRRNLAVAAQAGGEPVRAVYLAEADAGADGWAGRLRAALAVPVHPFDPVAGSPAADNIPPALRGRFAGPVGLLAARAAGRLPINFAQPHQPRAEADPGRNRAALVGLAAIVLLGGGAVAGYVAVSASDDKVSKLQQQVRRADEDIKRLEPDARRLAAADEIVDRGVNWLDEFYDLSARFPDIGTMRMLAFKGTAIPPPTDKEREKEKAAAKPANNAPKKPVAKIQIDVAAPDPKLPDALVNAMESRYYPGANKKTGPLVQGAGNGKAQLQQFTIEANVVHRGPDEYTRRLPVAPPPRPAAAPTPAPTDAAAPAEGGSAP